MQGARPAARRRRTLVAREVDEAAVIVRHPGADAALRELAGFRQEFYECLTARADALFELVEAVLCTDAGSGIN